VKLPPLAPLLALAVACGGEAPTPRAPVPDEAPPALATLPASLPDEPLPFRWHPTASSSAANAIHGTGAGDVCRFGGGGHGGTTSVRPLPGSATTLEVVHEDGAISFRREVPLPVAIERPVVLAEPDVARIAIAFTSGDPRSAVLVLLDATTGERVAPPLVLATGARHVQLERIEGELRAHVRLEDGSRATAPPAGRAGGGRTIRLDATTGVALAMHDTPAAVVHEEMREPRTSATAEPTLALPDGSSIEARWERSELVLRRTGAHPFRVVLRYDRFQRSLLTLHADGPNVVATVIHPNATGVAALALDAQGGQVVWTSRPSAVRVLGHSGYSNAIATAVEAGALRIEGIEAGGTYVCTLSLADGRELACVVGLRPAAVLAPAPATVLAGLETREPDPPHTSPPLLP
jgi:hypothetical protein